MAETTQYLATGRRKTSVARVFLRLGSGRLVVNRRPFENYFPSEALRAEVRQPLLATDTAAKFDVLILARGGGVQGQAGAARLGIARALLGMIPNCGCACEEKVISRAILAARNGRSTGKREPVSGSSSRNAKSRFRVSGSKCQGGSLAPQPRCPTPGI